jgi:hypothetical protein
MPHKTVLEKLEQNAVIHNHNTCQNLILRVQLNDLKKGIMNMGNILYSKLPNKNKKVEKFRQFKRQQRSYLLQHIFYSLDEYISC